MPSDYVKAKQMYREMTSADLELILMNLKTELAKTMHSARFVEGRIVAVRAILKERR